ncbi:MULTISPECIES: hypothetical protein [Actinomadura]|uniref:Guanylate cyclase domain-containing protein n=1 Tax=Actinomadura litoris TaxID=2678616 RepID=A0A7K1L0L8_9ACTN|nr:MULTISPECIES: hypothetical protein [Actinomadura]MBT2206916.1 hypothetical protein [Actinomadura sp. NEAU-AAG7]MUN37982.1 hypothetical protein [Actinomadura litoris]
MDERNGMIAGEPRPDEGRLGYHFLAAVDIEGFSRLHTLEQVRTQRALSVALDAAAHAAGLDRHRWTIQVTGDGELAVLPPGIDGPRLVADYPHELADALAAVNRTRHPASPPSAPRLRVRLALHHGPVADGHLGPAGSGPIVISRLLDLDPLRAELSRQEDEDLALIVSPALYDDVVRSRFRGLDPEGFYPVEQMVKGVRHLGYIRGGREPSAPAARPRAGPPRTPVPLFSLGRRGRTIPAPQ